MGTVGDDESAAWLAVPASADRRQVAAAAYWLASHGWRVYMAPETGTHLQRHRVAARTLVRCAALITFPGAHGCPIATAEIAVGAAADLPVYRILRRANGPWVLRPNSGAVLTSVPA